MPDLIITDLMMPGMDGLEVCRQVRGNDIINHIPIIVVTAKITEEERIKGLEAGADAYLTKPFNADELHTRVEKLLEGRHLLQEKYAQTAIERKDDQKPTTPQPASADLRFLSKRLGCRLYAAQSEHGCRRLAHRIQSLHEHTTVPPQDGGTNRLHANGLYSAHKD